MFSEICTQSPRRKARLFALSFLENKGVENIVCFALGGPGAEKTTILKFAMIPHQIYFCELCYVSQLDFEKKIKKKYRSLRRVATAATDVITNCFVVMTRFQNSGGKA